MNDAASPGRTLPAITLLARCKASEPLIAAGVLERPDDALLFGDWGVLARAIAGDEYARELVRDARSSYAAGLAAIRRGSWNETSSAISSAAAVGFRDAQHLARLATDATEFLRELRSEALLPAQVALLQQLAGRLDGATVGDGDSMGESVAVVRDASAKAHAALDVVRRLEQLSSKATGASRAAEHRAWLAAATLLEGQWAPVRDLVELSVPDAVTQGSRQARALDERMHAVRRAAAVGDFVGAEQQLAELRRDQPPELLAELERDVQRDVQRHRFYAWVRAAAVTAIVLGGAAAAALALSR